MSSKVESTIEEYVIDQLFNGAVSVNGKTKKPKFKKDGSVDDSKASYVSLAGDAAVFFALGNANVTAYYWNDKLDLAVAKTVAAGTVNNWGQAVKTSLTFARKAVTKKVYATGVDVTLFDTTGGDIFAGAYNKYDKKNPTAALSKTEGDVEITILNSTVQNVYAGGEGDDVYVGDVTVNVSNSKVGKIYAGGKTGAYTIGDLTVNITNDGNQMNGAAGYVFSGAIFGTPADKKSQSIGKTYVNVDNYNGAFKGALNYVEKVSVTGDSNVVFNGNFKEVDTISVVGGAIAEIKKGGAYEYEFVLNSDTVGNNNTAMLTLAKKLNPKKISIVVNNDFAHNGSVNLINWAGYTPSKKNVVILPNPTVKNERGGIIADYMYSYEFDAANQLIFTYTGAAYVLAVNDYTFGLADDVVLMSGMYDYTDKIVDLKGGLNIIDLGDSTKQGKEFKLTVTEASENVINAEDFAADVVILDRQSKGKNVVVAGTATGNVDFNKSAEAVLEATGDFAGNVDFSSVKGSAQVKLDNNASINAGSIESGANLVEVVVDAYSAATVKDLDFDAYLSGAAAGEYGDFLLNIGDNAVVSNGNDEILVNNYNRNEVVDNSDVTLYVMGEASGNTLVKGAAEFTVKNYGEVSGDINASYLYDVDGNKINRKDASVKFQNHGVFSGSINMDEQNGNDVFANASVLGSVTGNATVTADAEINFGGGKDKLQFFGNNTFEGNVTKLETSKLEMEFKRGVTDYNGTISYTQAFDAAPENGVVDGRYPAESDKFTGYDNTKITVTDAIVNVADGKELIANEIVVDNGKINGDFDFKKLTLANGTFVLDENMSFDGYDGEGATLVIGDNVNLYAQDLTLGTIETGDNAYLNTKNLTATMGDIAINGAADVDGNATAAKNVDLEGTEFNVTGTVAAGENVIVDADKLTAGAITAGENVGILADTVVSGAITAGGFVGVASENAAVTGDVTAANVGIFGNAVIDGNVNATEGVVVLEADDAIAVTGDVTAAGNINLEGTVSASDIEAVGAVTADGKLTADSVTGSNVEINGEAAVAGAITATEADVTLDGVISAAAVNAVKGDVTATMDVRNTMNLGEITAANVALTAANAFAANLTSTKVDDEAADIIKVGNIIAKAVVDNPDTIGVDESKAGNVTFDGDGIINAKDITADGAFSSTVADLTAGSIDAGSVAIDGTAKVADITADTFVALDKDVTAADITAGGAFTADGKLTADSIKAGSVAIDGTADVKGNIAATAGDVEVDGTLTVKEIIAKKGAVDVEGKLTAADVTGAAVTLAGDINAADITALNENVSVTASTANGKVANIKSAAAVDLEAAADMELAAANITAKGAVTLKGDGSVAVKDIKEASTVDITAATAVAGAINATGDVTVDTDDVTIASVATAGNVTIDSADATVKGEIYGAAIAINGKASIKGEVVGDSVAITGTANIEDNVQAIYGDVTLTADADKFIKAEDVAAKGDIDITGTVDVDAILAGGAFTAEGDLTADSIKAGSVAVSGSAAVAGDVTADGVVTLNAVADDDSITAENVKGSVVIINSANNVKVADVTADDYINFQGVGAVVAGDINAGTSFESTVDDLKVGAINAGSTVTVKGNAEIAGDIDAGDEVSLVTKVKGTAISAQNIKTADDVTLYATEESNVTAKDIEAGKNVDIIGAGTVKVTADIAAGEMVTLDAAEVEAGAITAGKDVTISSADASVKSVDAKRDVIITGEAVVDGDVLAGAMIDIDSKEFFAKGVVSAGTNVDINADKVTADKIDAKGYVDITSADATVNTSVTGASVAITGNATVTSEIIANKGDVELDGVIKTGVVDAAKNVTAAGELIAASVTGGANVDLNDLANISGAVKAGEALTANGDLIAASLTGGSVNVNGKAEISGDIKAEKGNVDLAGSAKVTGNVTAEADVTLDGADFAVQGIVMAKGNATVNADKVTAGMIGAEGAVVITSADAKVDTFVTGATVAITGNANVGLGISGTKFVDLDGEIVTGTIESEGDVTADGKLTAASVSGKNVKLTGDAKVTGAVTAIEGNVNVATYDDAAAQNIEIGSISAVLSADINAADLNDNVLVGAIDAKSVTLSGEGILKTGAVTATGEFVSTAKDATIESIDAGNVTITTVGGTKVGNIDSDDSVKLTANEAAAVIIADAVTAKGDVAVNGAGKVTAASVAGNNVNVNGNAIIDTVVAAKSAVVNGKLEAGSVQGADVVVNGTAEVTGAVSAVENLVTVNVDGVLNAGSISGKTGVIVAGVADVTAGVASAEGDIIVDGKLGAAGTVEALNGAVGVNGSMQAAAVNAESVKVAGTAQVTGAVTATKDVVVVGGTLNAGSIEAENVDVDGVVNVAGAINATGYVDLATNNDAVADTIKVGSIAAEGDVVLTAYENDKIEVGGDLSGNNVSFNGKGALVFLGDVTLGGNVTAKGDLAINVENVVFNGKVTAETLNISEGQTFTFNAGADIDTVTVKDASKADAAINIKNADAMLNVAVEADAALALELNGQNLEGAATLADNAKITVANGNFVGTITETGVNATVALKDATVTEVVFAGSNIEVENSGIVESLTIVNTLNITGVTGKDEFSVKSDIDAAAATITIEDAVTYFQNVTATVAVNDGAFNALSFAGSATGNGAVAIENWDDASGANSLNVGSIDITAQKADITGAMTATNGGIKVAGAKVAGNVTANRDEAGESVVDFAVADAYAGTITATATAGAIDMNIAGDLSGAAVDLNGAGVTLTTDSSFVAWNEGMTEIAANSNVVLDNGANLNVNGDYVGNLNGGDIAIDGKFFGAYAGNKIVKAIADVNSLTVNGNDAYGNTDKAFADAVFASSNKDAAAGVVNAINAKYQAGFVYAYVTANGDVTVNQAMTGAVTAGGKFTVGAYETQMDSIVYVDPTDVDAFQKTATVVDTLKVGSLDAASVKGQTVYYVNEDYKDNAVPEHNNVRLVVTVINGVNVTVTGDSAAVSGDFYGNMTAEKADVVMNGNILGGWAHTDGKGNWMLPDTDPSYQAEDVYEKATIVAGSFESTAEGKKIKADITAKVADINVVSDVEGNLTAEVGSVIAGSNVKGNVEAGKDVSIINGTVDGYVDADGDVAVLNVTGTVDGNNIKSKGTIEGKVTAKNDVFVNVVNADIEAGHDVTADGVITGSIIAGNDVTANAVVNGDIDAGNDVTANAVVNGNIDAKGEVNATDVTGYIDADGDVTANKVDGTVDGDTVKVVTAGDKVTAANDAFVGVAMNGIGAANDATVKVSATGSVTAGNNVFADLAAINGDVKATLGEVKAASVNGNITAGTDVTVTGTVTAPGAVPTAVVAGGTVNIGGQVGKAGETVDVNAGADAIFGADVYGNVEAGNDVDAKDVYGNITAGNNVDAQNVANGIIAGGYVNAYNVTGGINAGDYVVAYNVTGDITAKNNINAVDVVGAVESAAGDITLNSVVGDVTALNGDVTVTTTVNSDGYAAVTAQNVTIGGQAGDASNTVDIFADKAATLGGDVYGSVNAETVVKDGAITKITGDVTASNIALKDVNVDGDVTATKGNVVVGNVGMNLEYTGAGSIAAGNVGGDFSYTADAGVVDNIVVGNVAGSIDVTASIDVEEQAGGITVKVGNVGAADAAAAHIYLTGEEKLLHDHEVGARTVNTVLNFTAGDVYVDSFNIDGKSIANITATSIQGATVENVGVDKVYNGVFLNAPDCVKLTITGDIRIAGATVTNAEFVVNGNVTATEIWTWNGVDAYVFAGRTAAAVAAQNINISGNAEVSLSAENVTVGGNVIGNITADIADVKGNVTGNVTADVVTVGVNANGVFVAETIVIGEDFTGEATGASTDATFVANGDFTGTANGFASVTIGGNATLTGDLKANTIDFNNKTVVLNGNGYAIDAANLNFAADVDLTAGNIDLNGADLTVKNFTANAGVVDAGDITFTGKATVAGAFTGTLIGTDADNTLVLKGAFNGTFDLGAGYDKIDVDTDVTLAGLTGVEALDIAKDATLTFSSTFELTSALEVSLDAGTAGEDAIVNVTLGAGLDKLFIGGADWVWDSVNSRFAVAGATTGEACLTYDEVNDKLTWGTIA